jgi:tetratricopeptide (TPR) repeat protein
MYCKNCGNKSEIGKKFCTSCGNSFSAQNFNEKDVKDQPIISPVSIWQKINTSKIVMVLVVLGIIGYNVYSNRDQGSIDSNNKAITAYDSGDSTQAIAQFQEASQGATTSDTKIQTLKNLGYVYATEGKTDLAIDSFKQALKLTTEGSLDYYMISGEIADEEGRPSSAFVAYSKAYSIDPNDFQINNALALFYMDIYDLHPDFVDYKKAITHALKADQLSDLVLAKKNLAIAYFFNDNYDQTISILTSVDISNNPSYKYYLGLSYVGKEDPINAKKYLRQAIDGGMEVPQEVKDYMNTN